MNWTDIINEIKSYGKNQTEIAVCIGVSPGHISDILSGRRGKRMDHALGERLLDMRDRLARKAKRAA